MDRFGSFGPDSHLESPVGATVCTVCKEVVDTTEWYPVVTKHDGGDVQFWSFCTTECKTVWENAT